MAVQLAIRATCALALTYCVLAGCPALRGGSPDSTACGLAEVHIGRDYGSALSVGVAPSDLTIEKLTCLGRSLMRERRLPSISVMFFTSNKASDSFCLPIIDYPSCTEEGGQSLHATYSFDPRDEPQEDLWIWPRGWGGDFSSVDLSGAAPHRRKLELQNRCIMLAATSVTYPQEALKTKASGTITLTGTIGRDGKIKGIRVAEARVTPSQAMASLVNAARRDLRTWRLEAADHDDPLRVTYSYVIDSSLPRGGEPITRWDPPNQVEVRANAPK